MLKSHIQKSRKAIACKTSGPVQTNAVNSREPGNRAGSTIQRNWQKIADSSPQVLQAAQRQAKISSSTSPYENKTGLPNNLKQGIENLSGYSMADVRVHYNSDKPLQIQAAAYTQGADIHLATGQEKHLPHEAWHVVQQKQGRVKPTLQLKGVGLNNDSQLEIEADRMGAKAENSAAQQNRSLQQQTAGDIVQKKSTKKVSSTAYKRILLADDAIKHTKSVFSYGAGNQKTALWITKFNSFYRMKAVRKESFWKLTSSVQPLANSNKRALEAAKVDIARGGNCGEHASVAYDYLRVKAAGEMINRSQVKKVDHAFVLLGNVAKERDSQIAVSDPWPTNAKATLWEDHFCHVADKSKIKIHDSMVADGKNIKKVIAAGLSLTPAGQAYIQKSESRFQTIRILLNNSFYSIESAAKKGKKYEYYKETKAKIKNANTPFYTRVSDIIGNSKAIKLAMNTQVYIINKGKSFAGIKILSGPHKGKKGLVFRKALSKN